MVLICRCRFGKFSLFRCRCCTNPPPSLLSPAPSPFPTTPSPFPRIITSLNPQSNHPFLNSPALRTSSVPDILLLPRSQTSYRASCAALGTNSALSLVGSPCFFATCSFAAVALCVRVSAVEGVDEGVESNEYEGLDGSIGGEGVAAVVGTGAAVSGSGGDEADAAYASCPSSPSSSSSSSAP